MPAGRGQRILGVSARGARPPPGRFGHSGYRAITERRGAISIAPRYGVTLEIEEPGELRSPTPVIETSCKLFVNSRALPLRDSDQGPVGPDWTVRTKVGRWASHPARSSTSRVNSERKGWKRCCDGSRGQRRWTARSRSARSRRLACRYPKDGPEEPETTDLKPHLKKYRRILPQGNAAFVDCMEEVLEFDARPYAADGRVARLDETNKQSTGEASNGCGNSRRELFLPTSRSPPSRRSDRTLRDWDDSRRSFRGFEYRSQAAGALDSPRRRPSPCRQGGTLRQGRGFSSPA